MLLLLNNANVSKINERKNLHLHKMHLQGACFFTLKSFVATQMTIQTSIAQNDNEYSRCQILMHKNTNWNVINLKKEVEKYCCMWW